MTTRSELRQELNETRERFHALLASIPEAAFTDATDNPAWNVGQLLYHMSVAPRMLGHDLKLITRYNRLGALIPRLVPKRMFDWVNKHTTRFGARHMSHASLAGAYDTAHDAACAALDTISDDDLQKKLTYPDWDPLLSGDVTVERLFHYVKAHFDDHEAQLRAVADKYAP